MKIAIVGASGRMGLCVARLSASEGAEVVGAADSPLSPHLGRDVGEAAGIGPLGVTISADTAACLLGADVVIDFSTPSALSGLLRQAMCVPVRVVSGTTPIDPDLECRIEAAAEVIPVLHAPNMSLGVQVLAELATLATEKLGPSFDVEIVETHHRAKVDAPSGTAERLRRAVAAGRPNLDAVYGRHGDAGPRGPNEIGVHAVRGGDVFGDHTLHFLGLGERIELTHRATSRDVFARGALRAARFLTSKAPGRYSLVDVIRA
jgi:4-hydroxy-tetrahydrodipicolinate reductase